MITILNLGMMYKLTELDKQFIKHMNDEYGITPSFNSDGFYSFDMKPSPSFKDTILTKHE
jgi:hypothetical protein